MLYRQLISRHLNTMHTVLTDTKRSWNYKQLDELATRAESALRLHGVLPAHRALIVNNNSIDTVTAILGCIRAGVCFVILPQEISLPQLSYIIQDSAPSVFIAPYVVPDIQCLTYEQLSGSETVNVCPVEHGETALTYILYTSGSTGNPKGVMASETQVSFCIDMINRRLQHSPKDRILCCLPLSFDYGLYQLFLALSSEACLVLPGKSMLQKVPGLLVREQITGFPSMPAMLNMLLYTGLLNKIQLPDLRYITSTGDYFPIELIKKLENRFLHTRIIPMYGLTECKRVSIMPDGRNDKTLAGSCGYPLDGITVWLDEPQSDGTGELIVSGPNVMLGYWNDPVLTARYYFEDSIHGRCLRTGDLFQIDSEGFLYFRGRKRRILKVNGYRIGCVELEQRLYSEMANLVDELRVVGVPDALSGEKIVVCVSSGREADSLLDALRRITSVWPTYQRPHLLYAVHAALPKSANGKIDDKALIKGFNAHACLHV